MIGSRGARDRGRRDAEVSAALDVSSRGRWSVLRYLPVLPVMFISGNGTVSKYNYILCGFTKRACWCLCEQDVKMVFESVVVDVLNRFLGDYVVNLDSSQLSLGIWGGKRARCQILVLLCCLICSRNEFVYIHDYTLAYVSSSLRWNLKVMLWHWVATALNMRLQ